YDSDSFGAELAKTGYFENDVDALLKGLTTPAEKIAAIFNHVKSSVKWNDYYGYYCNDGVRKAYKDKTGNVAEINLMLTSMLRYAGLDANPVLISTRSNGISFFPNRNAFNYVIAGVDVNGQRILLDATERFSVPNVLPTRDLNWMGRLIRKDGTSEEIELMPSKLAMENVSITCDVKGNGDVEGKVRRQFSDHKALGYRHFAVDKAEEQLLENLESQNGQIQISNYKRENDREINLPVIETFSFTKNGAADVIGDKLYIDPLLFLAYEANPFKQDKRSYPVDFGFPSLSKYTVVMQLPEGYTVEAIPAALSLSTGDDIGSFKFMAAANGNTIQITFNETIGQPIVAADYYPVLKEFFQKMVEKQHEKIVLKKM
ncbi:MAG TPA: transglutaminase domain-containing protein, partial [Flavobacterium sp.]|nr:transglutaminase domain-containing protein [Flavobacterium sp.]